MANLIEDQIKQIDSQIEQLTRAKAALVGALRGTATSVASSLPAKRKRTATAAKAATPIKRRQQRRPRTVAPRVPESPASNMSFDELKRKADEEAGLVTPEAGVVT